MKRILLILIYLAGFLVHSQTDDNLNWVTIETFDLLGNIKGKSKSYFNDLGKQIQTQSLDVKTNRIWATQTLYDFQGRSAFQSLSAPIRDGSNFTYQEFVVKTNNSPLTASDIENINETSTLPSISTQSNKLGWFYSTNNSREPYQDITSNPYSKIIYSKLIPGTTLKNIGGNKIDVNGTPTFLQTFSFSMPVSTELVAPEAFNDSQYATIKTTKTISRGVDGVESVVFIDSDGNTLAAARSGNEEGTASTPYQISFSLKEQGYIDIHIPNGCENGSTTISITNQGLHSLNYYNLVTEETVLNITTPGFYRIAITNFNIDNYALSNPIVITHKVNYYDYSLNVYDKAGRLRVSKQPLGLLSVFNYNSLGQLTNTTSQDEGTVRFLYRLDGQIRFSQNSKQQLIKEFSYTNYDNLGRPIKSGIAITENFSTLNPNDRLFEATNFKEQHFTRHDISDTTLQTLLTITNLPIEDYKQTFLYGNVSSTKTDNPATNTAYYSYDEYGRVRWLLQNIEGLGVKTIDYEYDPVTSAITKVLYQKHNRNEIFVHRYTYNFVDQLIKVETSTDNQNYKEQAAYYYYETGALKRTELAENLQGIDYIYNLNGQLKAINDPSITSALDPGHDGALGSTFSKDAFGLALDYYNGDYTRTNTPTPIQTTPQSVNQYNGNIKATRWQTQTMSTVQNAYSYLYNKNNWLQSANFGTVNNTTAAITFNGNNDYGVSSLDYDKNGNLLSLNRNGHSNGGANAMDNFTYHYKSGKNQLDYVQDTNDNTDIHRYQDLKNQHLNNYNYNSIGQLIANNQDGITYIYNASGLVTDISKFSNGNKNFTSVFSENFESATVYETDPWSVENGSITINTNNSCNTINDNYGRLLEANYSNGINYTLRRDFTTVPNKNYKLKFDAFLKATGADMNISGIQINIKANNGTVLAHNFMFFHELTSITNCAYSQMEQLLDFTSISESVIIEFLFYPAPNPSKISFQFLLDNIELSVATEPAVSFYYDDRGHRIRKQSFREKSNGFDDTYYVRDASGSVMAIYTGNDKTRERTLVEQPIYGSSRLGVFYRNNNALSWDGYNYALTDHLGNVRSVISKTNGSSTAIKGLTDYYPFGMPMPDRKITDANGYRYAYQGQEKDPETGKEAFELRLWDGRIGRWLTTDPENIGFSPYLGMSNNPISEIDPDGGCPCSECPENCSEPNATTLFPVTTSDNYLDEVVITSSLSGNSNFNPSVALDNNTGYTYTQEDLTIRNTLMQSRILSISIKELEARGRFLPMDAEGYMNFVGVSHYNMYRFTAGVSLAYQVMSPPGAGGSSSVGRTFGYTPRYLGGANIKIHGNSLKSPKPTWFYKLYRNDGTFLKNGITSQIQPELRYTKAFMKSHKMVDLQLFPNRLKAYNFEYLQNTIQRGPLNLNMH